MVTGLQHETVKAIKVDFAEENVTSFGGLALAERLGLRAGLWRRLERALPPRGGGYSWLTIVKSMLAGLLSGSRGTFAAEELREDAALRMLLGLLGVPEEATVWRALEGLGSATLQERLARVQREWTVELLGRAPRRELLFEGFFPVFGDGTLLEGSRRREGTKYVDGKGEGLMWTTLFAGSFLAAQRLAAEGEGEQSCLHALLPTLNAEVLQPAGLQKRALVLLDSLHGDGPTCDLLEKETLHYIVGANKLAQTERILQQQPESQWRSTGARPRLGWADSAVCVCWIECEGWNGKRVLVGRRWVREGEMIENYAGVITNLEFRRGGVAALRSQGRLRDGVHGFARGPRSASSAVPGARAQRGLLCRRLARVGARSGGRPAGRSLAAARFAHAPRRREAQAAHAEADAAVASAASAVRAAGADHAPRASGAGDIARGRRTAASRMGAVLAPGVLLLSGMPGPAPRRVSRRPAGVSFPFPPNPNGPRKGTRRRAPPHRSNHPQTRTHRPAPRTVKDQGDLA